MHSLFPTVPRARKVPKVRERKTKEKVNLDCEGNRSRIQRKIVGIQKQFEVFSSAVLKDPNFDENVRIKSLVWKEERELKYGWRIPLYHRLEFGSLVDSKPEFQLRGLGLRGYGPNMYKLLWACHSLLDKKLRRIKSSYESVPLQNLQELRKEWQQGELIMNLHFRMEVERLLDIHLPRDEDLQHDGDRAWWLNKFKGRCQLWSELLEQQEIQEKQARPRTESGTFRLDFDLQKMADKYAEKSSKKYVLGLLSQWEDDQLCTRFLRDIRHFTHLSCTIEEWLVQEQVRQDYYNCEECKQVREDILHGRHNLPDHKYYPECSLSLTDWQQLHEALNIDINFIEFYTMSVWGVGYPLFKIFEEIEKCRYERMSQMGLLKKRPHMEHIYHEGCKMSSEEWEFHKNALKQFQYFEKNQVDNLLVVHNELLRCLESIESKEERILRKVLRSKNLKKDDICSYILKEDRKLRKSLARFLPRNVLDVKPLCEISGFDEIFGHPEFLSFHRGLLINCKKITISNLQLISLPDSIQKLTNLEVLDVQSNQISSLPRSIGELQKITHLSLQNNPMTELPESIINLRNLRHLRIEGANGISIRSAPAGITELPCWTNHNQWHDARLTCSEALATLNLCKYDNQNLKDIKRLICRWEFCMYLNLSNNNISCIPKDFGTLTSLRRLNLANNSLTAFPKELLNLTGLTFLDISGNLFNKIPEGVKNLRNLLVFMMGSSRESFNVWRAPPLLSNYRFYLNSLNPNFDIGYHKSNGKNLCDISGFLSKLKAIAHVDFSENKISHLPEEFSTLSTLCRLDLNSNEFMTFPEVLSQMGQLTSLNLSKNKVIGDIILS